ncbi:hypothetical protein [Tritonibacter scottomollicae]|uniref:Uncharacterized protein n=1 Tax=Tritonibacter scottomollicae TaxID=483013 RepID=A0A2T1AKG1_TRISK|nr:hypothetical protein CLV89_103399 [Tritonibacter scottomollicae]
MNSNDGGARVCATRKMAVPIGMRLRKRLASSKSHYNISDLSRFTSKCKMVRSDGVCSNSTDEQENPNLEEVFQELERWNDILKDDKDILRGPRP